MLRREMTGRYDQLATKIKVNYGSVDIVKQNILLSQKNMQLKVGNAQRSAHLFRMRRVRLKLVLNRKPFEQHLNEKFFYLTKSLTLSDKIKFLHLINDFEKIDLTRHLNLVKSSCYNYTVMPMTRNKIFFCMAVFFKKSFMKITDRKGVELCRRPITPDHYYRQFMASEDHVVALYDNQANTASIIHIYDDQLNLIAARRFSKRLELVSFNRYTCEIICRHLNNKNEYLFIGNLLKSTFLLRLSQKIDGHLSAPADSSAILLGASDQNVFVINLEKKYLKKINRGTAKPTGFYSVDEATLEALRSRNNFKFENNTLQLERSKPPVNMYTRNSLMSASVGNLATTNNPGGADYATSNEINLILKVPATGGDMDSDSSVLLKCYNQDGIVQEENSNDVLDLFKTIDFTSRNDLFYFNSSNKTLYFI